VGAAIGFAPDAEVAGELVAENVIGVPIGMNGQADGGGCVV